MLYNDDVRGWRGSAGNSRARRRRRRETGPRAPSADKNLLIEALERRFLLAAISATASTVELRWEGSSTALHAGHVKAHIKPVKAAAEAALAVPSSALLPAAPAAPLPLARATSASASAPTPPIGSTSAAPAGATPAATPSFPNILVNDPARDTTTNDTQSETSTIAFGNTVLTAFNDSGSHALNSTKFTGWSRSTDGGATFTDMGELPTNTNGDAGDPVLVRDNVSAAVYLATLSLGLPNVVQVFKSTDGGATFGVPVNACPGFTGGDLDKDWMAVDNAAGAGQGTVYLVIRDFGSNNGIRLTKSTNGGATWGPSNGTAIVSGDTVQGAWVAVGPDHAVYVFWYDGASPQHIYVRKSTDQGNTFGPTITVATLATTGIDGDLGLGFRTNAFPQAVVNPINPNFLYATYADKGSSPDRCNIYFTQSLDGGSTWSTPVKVNDDATTRDQWQPALAIKPNGSQLFIGWYDRRNDPGNSLIDTYGAIAAISGPTVTFRPNVKITTASFPAVYNVDPAIASDYMGDYDSASGDNTYFYYTWGDNRDNSLARSSKQANVRFARISTDLQVISTTPADGVILATPPTDFVIRVSDPYDPASIQAGDLKVNGIPADGITQTDAMTLTFHFNSSPVTAQGLQTLAIAAGAIVRLNDQNPISPFSSTFRYDLTPATVTSTNPANGSQATLPLTSIDVHFSEAIAASSLANSNLTLSQGSVSGFSLEDPQMVRYTLSGVTTEGVVTFNLAAGAVTDVFGNPCQAYAGSFTTDVGTEPMPAMTSVAPLGSLVYRSGINGIIGPAADVDAFTLNIEAGQLLTVTISGDQTLQPTVQVVGPSSNVLGTATADAAGKAVMLQALPVATAGTYTIIVGGAGGTTGTYAVDALLNAVRETEGLGGPSDDTRATAQNIDASFLPVGGGRRGAVVGALPAASLDIVRTDNPNDWYAFTLAAGEVASLAVARGTVGAESLALYDANGTLLASGAAGNTNVDQSIPAFAVPASGTYYAKVSGTTGADYELLVTRNVAVSLEPHGTFGTAQIVGNVRTILGAVAPVVAPSPIVVPGNLGSTEGNYASSYPFTEQEMRYQQIYDASQFGAGGYITALRFRRDASTAPFTTTDPNIRIDLAYAATTVAGLSSTFANNIGSGDQIVYNGSLTLSSTGTGSPNPFDIVIPLSSPFAYDPTKGNLLMDVRMLSGGGYGALLDASQNQQQTVMRMVYKNLSIFEDTGVSDGWGLVTRFDLASTGGGDDWYAIDVNSTAAPLSYSTSTPGDAPGEFTNVLSPHLEIYNPSGTLAASGTKNADGRNESVTFQPNVTGTYRVRVTAHNGTTGEYLLQQGNALMLSLPPSVREGDAPAVGTIIATTAPATNLTVNLSSADVTRLGVPPTVVIPAGQTSASFPLSVVDDTLLNGPQTVAVTASAGGYFAGSGAVTVHDNETAALSVALPATAMEGGPASLSGMVTASAAPTRDIVVGLSSSLPGRLSVPATVTIPAGQTTASFTATVVNDTLIEGTQTATVSATVDNWTSGAAPVDIIDDDNTIAVTLPASGFEGQSLTNAGTIRIGGTLPTPLVVDFASSDPSSLTVPDSVIVPAGQTTATFTVTLPSNAAKEGSRTASVTATAGGLTAGNGSMVVHDGTLDHFAFDPIASPQTVGSGFVVTAHAYNILNELIPSYAASGTLAATGQGGPMFVSPTTITFKSGTWSGTDMYGGGGVGLTKSDPAVTLTLTADGLSATSNAFAVQAAAVKTFTFAPVPSPQVAGAPFPVTLSAQDRFGNPVTAFNGPVNLTASFTATLSQPMYASTATFPLVDNVDLTNAYSFRPIATTVITHFRTFYGTKVSLWTDSGTLLATQAVTGAPGTWTETPLATPVTLQAGVTYRVGVYSGAGGTRYYRTFQFPGPGNPSSFATFEYFYSAAGDAFPSTLISQTFPAVDLRGSFVGTVNDAVTPATVTFTNGVYNGNISLGLAGLGVQLHAFNGTGAGDSNSFDVSIVPVTGLTYVRVDPDHLNVSIWQGLPGPAPAAPIATIPLAQIMAQLPPLAFAGSAGDDTLMIDFSNGDPLPPTGATFSGGGGNDAVRIIGTAADDIVTASAAGASFSTGGAPPIPIALTNVSAIGLAGGSGGSDTLNLTSGAYTIDADTPASAGVPNVALDDGPGASATLQSDQHLASLTVDGGSVTVAIGTRKTISAGMLSILGNGSLDLTGNDLLTNTAAAAIRAYLLSAYSANDDWSGPTGLTSSIAASNPSKYTVAYAVGSDPSAQDAGLGLIPGQTLVRPTLVGDANLDGKVNFFDLTQILAYKYNTNQPASYTDGDLNYDGNVNFFDIATLLSANYNTGAIFSSASAVATAATARGALPSATSGAAPVPAAPPTTLKRRRSHWWDPQTTFLVASPFPGTPREGCTLHVHACPARGNAGIVAIPHALREIDWRDS
jgi:hypothetical protein